MVQRKVPIKLALQPDHQHITENLVHLQDVKNNKGADLKKKMKKSGSIKRPKQPAKPPPLAGKTASTPNYMKPTTSSDARKEQSQSQVSTRNPHASPHSSTLRRKSSDNSKISSSSRKKVAAKTLLARTLTKIPSFKPVRASARKCSTIVLCENLDAQRATCSSTLKDCKFPAYLSLNHGGSESEGTSAIKVCPYTYCSLNGHHHEPLPPLKSFLSARRLMIKTQRSFKLGCLSPRRVKPVEEENKDFFIEIYRGKDENSAAGSGIEGSGRDSSIIDDEAAVEYQEERVLETVSDAPICDDSDTHEVIDENRDVNVYPSEQNQEVKEVEASPPVLAEADRNLEFLTEDSEGSDMDWEQGYHSPLNINYDYDYDYSPATEDIEPDPEASAGETCIISNEFVTESDIKDWCFDESLVDEVCPESYAESLNSDAFSSSDDDESSDLDNHLQIVNTMYSPAPVEVQEEEEAPVHDEENHILSETSFDNIIHQSLENEDSITVMEDLVSNLENSDENIINLSTVDSGKQPHSEGAQLKSTEAEMEDSRQARFTGKPKKPVQESDELGSFNPRGPNFLPLEPGPEAEKVDLKHQDLDEKKNAEEWMVDYALRQVVTKLGPARKRKVALLVEAFEKVMPVTKCDLQLRHGSAFEQARPIQACN